MRLATSFFCAFVSWALCAAPDSQPAVSARPCTDPLTHRRKLSSPLVEVTPFVFKDRLYLLDNWQITEIELTSSDDLLTWTKPVVVLSAQRQEPAASGSVDGPLRAGGK